MTELPADAKRSYRIDTFRQSADGMIQPLIDSVFMLVAIQFFAVGDFWKGLISASNFIGFLLSAPLTGLLNRSGVPRSRVLAILTSLAGLAMAFAAISSSGVAYALSVSLASAAVHLRQPFFSDLYGELYPPESRARLISLGLRLNLVLVLITGLAYGRILNFDLGLWRWISALASLVLIAGAVVLSRLPGEKPVPREENWLQAMAMPFSNPVFVYMQTAWMIIGFGNLWVQPLRSVYLAEQERGLGLSPVLVTVILVVIPAATRLLFNPLWARLYQRLSIPLFRLLINLFFMTSIPLFFLTDKVFVIGMASFLFGIGTSGSPFIWQLWVTRIVPPGETRIYQSAHAFLAGLRGISAPFIGFAVLQGVSFRTMGFISGFLAFIATMMMLPLMQKNRRF